MSSTSNQRAPAGAARPVLAPSGAVARRLAGHVGAAMSPLRAYAQSATAVRGTGGAKMDPGRMKVAVTTGLGWFCAPVSIRQRSERRRR
jgi:hypothetical protein